MQIDATMGAVTAIQELFAHDINGVLYFFRGIPKSWKQSAFEAMHLPGGLIASGEYCKGKTVKLSITATRDITFRYKLPDHEPIFTVSLKKGETFSATL